MGIKKKSIRIGPDVNYFDGMIKRLEKFESTTSAIFEPIQLKFVIDAETETKCNFGEYHDHDGTIIINLLHMDDQSTLISTIIHEVLHKITAEDSGEKTTSEQDHFIIPRMMS